MCPYPVQDPLRPGELSQTLHRPGYPISPRQPAHYALPAASAAYCRILQGRPARPPSSISVSCSGSPLSGVSQISRLIMLSRLHRLHTAASCKADQPDHRHPFPFHVPVLLCLEYLRFCHRPQYGMASDRGQATRPDGLSRLASCGTLDAERMIFNEEDTYKVRTESDGLHAHRQPADGIV